MRNASTASAFSRPATRLLLLMGAITVAALLGIRVIALHGYEAVTPIFFRLLVILDDHGAIWMAVMLVVAGLLASRYRWQAAYEQCGRRPWVVAIATTVVLSLGTLLVYRNVRLSMDEYIAYFQSQVFASGNLAGQFPAELKLWLVPIGFLTMSDSSGEVASSYLPGFALLLAPFTWLGIPWACNALLTGLSVLVIHRLAMRLYQSTDAAGLAVLLTVASPVVFANGITYYSMTACMLANATFALLLLGELNPRRLLLAGLVGSVALTLHSPARHAPFAVPLMLWVLTRPGGVRKLVLLGVGYLPLTFLLGAGWTWFVYHLADLTASDYQQGISRVVVLPSMEVLLARFAALLKIWLWAVPGLLLLAVMGTWRWRADLRVLVLAASGLLLLGAYLLMPFDQGHGWGYRYFHPAWFVLPLLAAGLAAPGKMDTQQESTSEVLNLIGILAIVSLTLGIGARALQIRVFIDEHLAQLPQFHTEGPRRVFIDSRRCFYCVDLVQNDPFLAGDELRLHSHGSEKNAALVARYWPGFRRVHSDANGEVYAGPEK